jgi:hypothetical protein
MPKYEVQFTHVIHRTITAEVEADDEKQALVKARDWDFELSDEDCAPEDGMETMDHRVIRVVEE